MANELKHKGVGVELTQAEFEALDGHVADGQTANDMFYFNGTYWIRATPATIAAILDGEIDLANLGAKAHASLTGVGASDHHAKYTNAEALAASAGKAIFGDGSDGDVTISTNTSLSRDMFYDDLTVNNGVVLTTAGYRIFVKGTLTNNGTISGNGNNGTNGSAGAAGVGGAAVATGSLGGSGAGGNGGATFSSVGGTGGSIDPGLGGNGGEGGGDLESGEHDNGPAGTVTAPTAAQGGFKAAPQAILLHEPDGTKVGGGAGGGGGGSAGDSYGGGAGSGGGLVLIIAKTIVNGSGTIRANGGNGGVGGTGTTRGSGGGGGGGGGLVVLIYNSLTAGTEQASAGTGGAAGSGGTTNGTAGDNGSAGTVIKVANA